MEHGLLKLQKTRTKNGNVRWKYTIETVFPKNLIGLRIQMEHGLLKLQKTRKKFFLFFCFEISTLEKN